MGQVSVTINGRQYRMACEDGQENHLARLSQELDQRITRLRTDFGEIGDMRLTVMAALIVADELSEQGQRLRRLEDELTALQDARMVAADRAKANEAAIAAAFNAAAGRIEKLAKRLIQGSGPKGIARG
ncbi:MAG TPA: cell division protein ZapA [Xanthobacteraceae bacterium]|jgi:cell division protein ZapA